MTVEAPGIYGGVPIDDYVADPVAHGSLSSSELGTLLTCPAKLGYGKRETAALSFGSAAHHLVLEGEVGFHDRYLVAQHDGRTLDGKAERQHAADHGLALITQAQRDAIEKMAAAIRAHSTAHDLLTSGPPEQTLIWQDEATGVWLRSRPDVLPRPWLDPTARSQHGAPPYIDYKTCRDASATAISKALYTYGYARQAALGCDSIAELCGEYPSTAVLVCQETEPPYVVAVHPISDTALDWGRRLNRWAIEYYQRCVATGEWPGYADLEPVGFPPWADREIERIKETIQPETQAAEQEQPDPEEVWTP